MDVKCPGAFPSLLVPRDQMVLQETCTHVFRIFFPGCFAITTVFSHAQTVVVCPSCTSVLCQPTGGKARLTEGASASSTPQRFILLISLLPHLQVAHSVERTKHEKLYLRSSFLACAAEFWLLDTHPSPSLHAFTSCARLAHCTPASLM